MGSNLQQQQYNVNNLIEAVEWTEVDWPPSHVLCFLFCFVFISIHFLLRSITLITLFFLSELPFFSLKELFLIQPFLEKDFRWCSNTIFDNCRILKYLF